MLRTRRKRPRGRRPAEQRDEVAPFQTEASRASDRKNSTPLRRQETAALRNFDPVYVGSHHLVRIFLVSMAMNTSGYPEPAEATRTSERRCKVKRRRILVVEDDQLSLTVLGQLLTAQCYEILQSSEGWDGINRARNEQPDLIVMDIKLPDISGLDATLLLKKDDQTKAIPIIAVTGCVTPEDKANALKSGCAAYITKPVKVDELLRTVELFLPSSSPQ